MRVVFIGVMTTSASNDSTSISLAAAPVRQSGLLPWVPSGRRLILVDIENVVGGSLARVETVAAALADVRAAVSATLHDVWIVACGPRLLAGAASAFTSRVLLGAGVDGADRRLVECLHPDSVVGRYASVVLVSGDAAAFAQPVSTLASGDIPTDVYVGSGHVGAELYRAARSVTSLCSMPKQLAA